MRPCNARLQKGAIRARQFRVSKKEVPSPSDANQKSRPGILVLINDADWELEGEDKYELMDGDNVLFVSTLHGG